MRLRNIQAQISEKQHVSAGHNIKTDYTIMRDLELLRYGPVCQGENPYDMLK